MMGNDFKDQVEAIMDETPDEKQTLLFSATMPPGVKYLSFLLFLTFDYFLCFTCHVQFPFPSPLFALPLLLLLQFLFAFSFIWPQLILQNLHH